jgi:monovalent cation:H+ antiporter-2, CPA2 family
MDMVVSVLKLSFFLVLWFIAGIFLVPTFLKRTRKLMTDETMLIVSLALCILMVVLATNVGFSPALGAFIMGSILAETPQAERVEHLTKSVKDLFAAVFFVSVGMLIDPAMLAKHYMAILIISAVTVGGKFLSSSLGALLSGQPLKTSVQTGMSLAQIGEFSFIIATLGLTLNVTSGFLYPIAVAVSAITTFTTPYLISLSAPLYTAIERVLPENWVMKLNKYSSGTAKITTTTDWKILLRAYIINILIHSVILISIIILSSRVIYPFVIGYTGESLRSDVIAVILTFILMAPFLWALSVKRVQKTAYSHLWLNRKVQRGPLIAIEIFRILLAILFSSSVLYIYFETWIAISIAVTLLVVGMFLFSTKLQAFYDRLEKRFLLNLNARNTGSYSALIPWESHLAELEVSPESAFVGKTLEELAFREKYGINIALIERGKLVIATPGREERLFPNDKLTVIGTDEQLARVKEHLEVSDLISDDVQATKKELELQKVIISHTSPVCYKTIRDSGIRELSQGLVVAIERDNERFLNPDSSFEFRPGDTLFIVGNKKRVREVLSGQEEQGAQ